MEDYNDFSRRTDTMKKRLLFTICGRAGSKGIKSKNVRVFCGFPLVYYTLQALKLFIDAKADLYDYDIVLSTDSGELIEQILQYKKLQVEVINRTEALCGDLVGKKDVILDCLNKMEERKGYHYNAVVDLDITSPLRTVQDIENLVEKYFLTDADIVYSVTTARRNPYFNQVMKKEKGYVVVIPSDYTARQQTPEVYDMNASLYVYNPNFLKAGGGFDDGYYEVIYMYDTGILDLDHENDFELMQVIAEYLFSNNNGFAEIYNSI